MKFLLLFLLFTTMVWGQVTQTMDVTHTFDKEVSEDEARNWLISKAAVDALIKTAPDLGFAKDQFEKKLKEKFESYFSMLKEKKLLEKYGANYKTSVSDKDKESFQVILDSSKEIEWVRFTRSKETLSSFSVKSLIQNQNEKKTWTAQVALEQDKSKLLRTYRRIMSDESKPYNKILILADIYPQNLSWADLGLETGESFTAPIKQSWHKWLEENLPTSVEEAEVCVSDCLNYWSKWSEQSPDELTGVLPMDYVNSLWLKVDLNLGRLDASDSSKRILQWEGRVVVLDVNTKRLISSFEISREKKTIEGEDQQKFNSTLASAIYRSPLGAFVQLSKILQDKIGLNRVSRLVIKGQKHLQDVLVLMEMLKTRGASLGLEVQLDNFKKDEAQIICYYKGEEKSFSDLLSDLKELKSSQSYALVNEFNGIHHLLKLVAD